MTSIQLERFRERFLPDTDLQRLREALDDEDTFDRAESMYRALWRSEPMKASELDPNAENPDELMVELCNYKGEGEGEGTFEEYAHLPVFVNKEASYRMF